MLTHHDRFLRHIRSTGVGRRDVTARKQYQAVFCIASALWILGCAGPARISLLSGTCDTEFERCVKRCQTLKDPLNCELRCRFYGKFCQQARAEGVVTHVMAEKIISKYKVLMVDLETKNILHSNNAKFKIEGAYRYENGAYSLDPGATMVVAFEMPSSVRQADFVLRHGPGGSKVSCFVTIKMGVRIIGQRYSPPRSTTGRLRMEKWSLTPDLAQWPSTEDGRKTVTLTIHNNAQQGSKDPYRISSVELYYRTVDER
ncbi:MAG: hypothetical protein VX589_07445 [Myxococcota bacterium]|nr:hypothetical protein [Myxococcota bacterium]